MKKRIICLMLSLILVIVSFAGCGQKTNESVAATASVQDTAQAQSTQEDASKQAFTIAVASWFLVEDTDPSNPVNQNYMDAVEKAYKEKYPNATIKWDLTTSEKYFDLLKAKLASGTADDVFFHQNMFTSMAKGGYLADLSDEPYADKVVESTKPSIEYGGKLYGVVRSVDGWACWYNKKMFSENGWSTPKTWDEFLNLCETIKAKGIAPLLGGFKNTWTISGFFSCDWVDLLYQNPNWEYDRYDSKVKFNGPEYQKQFKKFETLIKNSYYNKDCLSIDWDQSRAEFGTGKGAMMFMGDWLPVQMVSEYKDFETGVMLLPDEDGNTLIGLSINQVVSANAKAKDLRKAKDLVGALLDKDAMEAGLKNNGFSGVKDINPEYTIPGAKEFADEIQTQKSVVDPGALFPTSMGTVFINIMTEVAAGKAFEPSMLDELDKTYEQDKNQINMPD